MLTDLSSQNRRTWLGKNLWHRWSYVLKSVHCSIAPPPVFSPGGAKVAVIKSGSLAKATIPLPGGETAVYNSSELEFIRHTDWLGSSRSARK
jgi:hypothetical protein